MVRVQGRAAEESAATPAPRAILMIAAIGLHIVAGLLPGPSPAILAADPPVAEPPSSPVDLLLTSDESHAIVAEQTADSLALVDLDRGCVVSRVPCGRQPRSLAMTSSGRLVLATASDSGELLAFELSGDRLTPAGSLRLGGAPWGVAISPDDRLAYVALSTASAVAVVDVESLAVVDRISVGHWPRHLALSGDGSRLAVGCSGSRGVAVVDTATRRQLYLDDFAGLNLGQMQISADGRYVYFPWIVYRRNPITAENIRRGWVLASRIARVKLDGSARREAISLDPQGEAVGDPHGLALSPDEQTLVCTAAGTHELLIFRLPGLPFQDYGGPGDHIDEELHKDRERFARVPLGGRPLAVRFSRDGTRVYVANYLLGAVQVVDVSSRRVVQTIELSPPREASLARQGEAIFYDARRSLDQWYSCHSCHFEGHTNAVTIDTNNDGRFGNYKTVLSLRGAAATGPWFWHGWESDLPTALHKSLTDTMLGPRPTDDDVAALGAFIKSLEPATGERPASADQQQRIDRGQEVFNSARAGCANCHPAPHFTDGLTHDVGLGKRTDVYDGFNTPSLRGVTDRVLLLHAGQARSLDELLTGPHNPAQVTGQGELSDEERQALVAYLRSL
ncbi:MAG: beta-propeller fold lactonase family protein [Pirellulales bacterium]